MHRVEGGAIRPSLFVFIAALLLLGASLYAERWYHWSALTFLLFAWMPAWRYPTDGLGIVIGLFCAWLFGNALFVTPVYSAESVYQPLILLGGFLALASTGRASARLLLVLGLALAAALVLLGFLQYFAGVAYVNDIPQRASGAFKTPNSFGTALNLFLAPLVALYLLRGSRWLLALAFWLFAGLVSTESRGAMVALAMAFLFILISIGPAGLRKALPRVGMLLAGFVLVWVTVAVARAAIADRGWTETWLHRAVWDRRAIYEATASLLGSHPLAGEGANMFFPLFETVKPDSLGGADYHYAHSDYLQVLLEFGAAGLLLLLLIAAGSLFLALRSYRRTPEDPLPLACGAALTGCFAHAAVDFPLYVPFFALATGAYLGALSRHSGQSRLPEVLRERIARIGDRLRPPVRWALAFASLAWLSQPVIADAAANRCLAQLSRGDARDALYWQRVAERFEPHDPARYWAEGIIWRDQLEASRNPLFAAEADSAFLRGASASPYDVANVLARVQLHRQFGALLKRPLPPAELVSLAERAAVLRPQQAGVQAEYARTLAFAGRRDDARSLARELSKKFPTSESVRRLAREL